MSKRRLKAKALLIDLDGTIVDSSEAFAEAAKTALSAIGCNQSSDNVGWEIARRLQLNLPIDDLFAGTCIHEAEALREKFLALFLQAFYKIAQDRTKPFPDVDKTLRNLSESFQLALITRRPVSKELVKKELQRLRLDGYFATIVTAAEVKNPTPSPETILKVANEFQVPSHSCVIVSDSGVDIQAGRSAGAKTVAVLSGLFKKEELSKEMPDLILENITHLSEHLLAI